jgi:two-component system, OmpR family, sensor kinase
LVRFKLILAGTLLFAAFLAGLGIQLYHSTQQTMLAAVDRELQVKGKFLTENFEKIRQVRPEVSMTDLEIPPGLPNLGLPNPGLIDPATKRLMQDNTILNRPRIFDENQKPLLIGFDEPFDRSALKLALRGRSMMTTVSVDGKNVRVLSIPIHTKNQSIIAGQVTSDLSQVESALGTLKKTMLWFIPIAAIASMIGGVSLAAIALRPVARIANVAEQIEASSLELRLPVEPNDEFGKLGRTFNNLFGRLQVAFDLQSKSLELQKRFTADASHELKTPLTALKARIGIARKINDIDQVQTQLAMMDDIADRMNGLIFGLLTLARAEDGKLKLELEQERASRLLEAAIKIAVPGYSGIVSSEIMHVSLTDDPVLLLDPPLMAQALANVIQNGVRYSPSDRPLVVRGRTESNAFVICIEDYGAGIAPDDLPHIFDRFYRSDLHRSREGGGTGLGLAITRAIVEAHQGQISAESILGSGSSFTLRFPLDVSEML